MFDVEGYLLDTTEHKVEFCIKRQHSKDRVTFGAIPWDEVRPVDPKSTAYQLLPMVAAWLHPKSRFYQDASISSRMDTALDYIRRTQLKSGCFNFETVNFNSAPDTAFILWALIPMYRLLGKHPLAEKVHKILMPAFEGICKGGFHTPNHRWANASALAAGYNITKNPAYLKKAQAYLAEGIDCNAYGEYSEKSANYNAVNNTAMIMLHKELGDEKYLEYVRKNLNMTIHYMDYDGSLFTENSSRQDKGTKFFPGDFYFQYMYIAHRYKCRESAQTAAFIIDNYRKNRYYAPPDCLYLFMLHPEICLQNAEQGTIPDYNRHFEASGIVRYKSGDFSYALLEDNNKFFCFSIGALSGYMKLSVGYFSARHIRAKGIRATAKGYAFDFAAKGWYYEPLEHVEEEIIDFLSFDNSLRKLQYPNSITLTVEIAHVDGGIDISFATRGLEGVHYCFEFVLPPGKFTTHSSFAAVPEPGSYMLLKSGDITISDNNHDLIIGDGFADRQTFRANRGADLCSVHDFTVFMLGTTNFDRIVKIRGR